MFSVNLGKVRTWPTVSAVSYSTYPNRVGGCMKEIENEEPVAHHLEIRSHGREIERDGQVLTDRSLSLFDLRSSDLIVVGSSS